MTNEERKDAERVQLEQAAARAVDLDALPKALSEEERDYLASRAPWDPTSVHALAWIDAATALLAEQAAQIVTDGQRIAARESLLDVKRRQYETAFRERAEAEARVRGLEARLENRTTELKKATAAEVLAEAKARELEARARDAEDSFGAEQSLRHAAEAKVRELEAARYEQEQRGNNYCEAAMAAEARVRELEAENDRLDESFEEAAEERQHAETRAEVAEARGRELEDQVRRLRDVNEFLSRELGRAQADADRERCERVRLEETDNAQLVAVEQKLSDANALLDEAKHVLVDWNNYQATEGLSHIPEDETAACLDKLEAHLAGQPAAPKCACGHPDDAGKHGVNMCEIDEDEPHVCDGFARFTCRVCGRRRDDDKPAAPSRPEAELNVCTAPAHLSPCIGESCWWCKAELARRGLK